MNSTEREFCENLKILTYPDSEYRVLCAFSGGVDSLALLILLVKSLGAERVVPLYVNHNLRSSEELKREIALNRSNCLHLGSELQIRTVENGQINKNSKEYGGTEASARHYRYAFLQQAAEDYNCKYIATAHHLNDQLETVLMKIISNAPVTALRGIAEKTGNIIRPLLEFKKKELETYVKETDLLWFSDSTNNDNSIKRNEIRNVLIPQLNNVLPDWDKRVLRIRKYALSKCGLNCGYNTELKDRIAVEEFRKLPNERKLMVLYALWDANADGAMPQTLAQRVIDSSEKEHVIISANGGTFCIYRGFLYIVNNYDCKKFESFRIFLNNTEGQIRLLDDKVLQIAQSGSSTDLQLDFSLFDGTPYIRYVKNSDRIFLKDGSKTVLKLLQDQKIPVVFRNRVPVIADDKEVCAVLTSALGGKDRLCAKMRSALAPFGLYVYFKR